MLQVNLDENDYRVARAVIDACTRFGVVTAVRVHRQPSPFALIDMLEREHAFELAAQFGGSMFGKSVLIHLEALRAVA
jgi:hypothetical protein